MPQFVTAGDLATRLGVTFTTDQETRADALLAEASELIAEEAKQQIALVTDDVLTMPGTTDEVILLPERPVVEVSSVILDGTPLEQGVAWYLDGAELRRMTAMYINEALLIDGPYLLGTGFGWPKQTLEITYTHGWDADNIPATVTAICKEMVVRVWVNPGSVARKTVGNVTTTYDNMRFSPTGLLMTDGERARIRRFFGRRAASIQIGS